MDMNEAQKVVEELISSGAIQALKPSHNLVTLDCVLAPANPGNDPCIATRLRVLCTSLQVHLCWRWRLPWPQFNADGWHWQVVARVGPLYVSFSWCFGCWRKQGIIRD